VRARIARSPAVLRFQARVVAERRHADRAQHRPAVAHQADVHGELVPPGRELPRPIQRVDQPVLMVLGGGVPGRHLLLRHDGDAWGGGPQRLADQRLGGMVRLRHRAFVGFMPGLEPAGAHGEDHGPGTAGQVGGEVEQRRVIHPKDQTTPAPAGEAKPG